MRVPPRPVHIQFAKHRPISRRYESVVYLKSPISNARSGPARRAGRVVRAVGVEPTRAQGPTDFKSGMSTIPSRPHRPPDRALPAWRDHNGCKPEVKPGFAKTGRGATAPFAPGHVKTAPHSLAGCVRRGLRLATPDLRCRQAHEMNTDLRTIRKDPSCVSE